jgi:hypothetical protein
MPEQQPAPVAPVGGYPPMPMMQWAAPGWPQDGALTPLTSPDAARLALHAESQTSVLDPVGLRWLWLRELNLLFALAIVVLAVTSSVQFFRDGETPWWWLFLLPLSLIFNVAIAFMGALWRAVPGREVIPRLGPARWRWYRSIRRQPAPAPTPPAVWPPGSEAYAVLAGAGSVESVACLLYTF